MRLVLFIAVILVLGFIFIRFLEYKSTYFPFHEIENTPADIGLKYEDIEVTAADGIKLNAWFVPSAFPRATVLFSHGNGGNISHRLEKIRILNNLNLNILIYDYRGYGRSKGSPSESGLYIDADAMYDFLIKNKNVPAEKIIAYGESLGGAVAADLAGRHDIGAVIIEGSFTSVRDIAEKILPFIPSIVYKSRFDTLQKIGQVKAPKLIMHSINDEIIPYEHGKKLFEKAGEPKQFAELRGGHNDAFLVSQDVYISAIDSFAGSI